MPIYNVFYLIGGTPQLKELIRILCKVYEGFFKLKFAEVRVRKNWQTKTLDTIM